MSKTDNNVVWFSLADESWGECAPKDLIVVKLSEMTQEEYDRYLDCDHEEDVRDLLVEVRDRIAGKAVA